MKQYETTRTKKLNEAVNQLSPEQAILKAVADARIDLQGLEPLDVYKTVMDRINKSELIIDESYMK